MIRGVTLKAQPVLVLMQLSVLVTDSRCLHKASKLFHLRGGGRVHWEVESWWCSSMACCYLWVRGSQERRRTASPRRPSLFPFCFPLGRKGRDSPFSFAAHLCGVCVLPSGVAFSDRVRPSSLLDAPSLASWEVLASIPIVLHSVVLSCTPISYLGNEVF